MPTLCPFLRVPRVGLQSVIMAFLGHTLSFCETIIIVDDNTIVLYKSELYICSSYHPITISFRGLYNLLYLGV